MGLLGEPTAATAVDCGASLMSEGARGTWVKVKRASGRLYLGNDYMSANGQADNAHFPWSKCGPHEKQTRPWTALGFSQEGDKELPLMRVSVRRGHWRTMLKEKYHPCHWSCSLIGPEGKQDLKHPQRIWFKYLPSPEGMMLFYHFQARWNAVPRWTLSPLWDAHGYLSHSQENGAPTRMFSNSYKIMVGISGPFSPLKVVTCWDAPILLFLSFISSFNASTGKVFHFIPFLAGIFALCYGLFFFYSLLVT